jgi:methionyl-tRNA synthetase
VAINLFRLLTIYLAPVLPALARQAEAFLQVEPLQWAHAQRKLPSGHRIAAYRHLMVRVEPKQVDALFEAPSSDEAANAAKAGEPAKAAAASESATIGIDEFSRIDLRVARITAAEAVGGSDKLLRLTLDVGDGRPRQVFSGIKSAYQPADLVGRLTVVVANLAPRKMKFGLSEGMVLAASDAPGGRPGLFLLEPDPGAEPGMRVT